MSCATPTSARVGGRTSGRALGLHLALALALVATRRARGIGFKPDGRWRPSLPASVGGSLGAVSACAVGEGGEVYVGQRGKQGPSILVLDGVTGNYTRGFGQGVFKTVHGMHMQGAYLWVTDSSASKLHKFEASTGKLVASYGQRGTDLSPLSFGSVADVAFDAKGAVYVSDGDGGINARVLKLDTSMAVAWAVGNNGTVSPALGLGPFASPHSLAYSAVTNTVFVADRNHNQLRALDAATGHEANATWTSAFHSPGCDKPSIWSVRTSAQVVFVANANFGSGSKCPGVAADAHLGRISILPLPAAGSMASPDDVVHIPLNTGGFPHEICIASDPKQGVYAAAVDSADLPPGTGIRALTKYTLQP